MLTSHSTWIRQVARPVFGVIIALLVAVPATGQTLPTIADTASLAGPRFGMTLLSSGIVDALADRGIAVRPNISQFGWQWEKQFFTRDSGVTMVSEWVGLVGGLDQGVVLPSASWLIGIRGRDGTEFGIGPNVTPAGVALVLAVGKTFRTSTFNVPVNLAVVPSKSGTRISIMTGFNLRR